EESPNAGKDVDEIMQLQAQLAAAHARVAKLEAQAAQDEPLGSEEGSPRATSEELEEIILQLQAQLSAAHMQVEQLQAQATQDERSNVFCEDSKDFMQLQAELSTAHTRVAELEAQAAQDKPVALEASHYEARIVELERELHELRSRTDPQASEVKPSALDLDEPKVKDGGNDGWDDFDLSDVQPAVKPSALDLDEPKVKDGG
ncbi:unnamed protein product, partial [Durusdinium trenchii]